MPVPDTGMPQRPSCDAGRPRKYPQRGPSAYGVRSRPGHEITPTLDLPQFPKFQAASPHTPLVPDFLELGIDDLLVRGFAGWCRMYRLAQLQRYLG